MTCVICGLLLYSGTTCDRCLGIAESDPFDGSFDDLAKHRYPRDNVIVVWEDQPVRRKKVRG